MLGVVSMVFNNYYEKQFDVQPSNLLGYSLYLTAYWNNDIGCEGDASTMLDMIF